LLAAVLCPSLWSCTRARYLEEISQVSYTEASGTIPPELQLYEEVVITEEKVTLRRNGRTPDTEVNEGEWEAAVEAQGVRAFFEQLEAIDCSTVRRVEPAALEIGGGTESYTIVYAGDRTFYLGYGGGVTYTDGMLLVAPIETFIDGLTFPAGAASQYKDQPEQP
jgi:hypothetical protein